MTKPKKRRTLKSFRRELWQDGVMVAAVECKTMALADHEIWRYAAQYAQDGPVLIKYPDGWPDKRANRRKRT